MAGLATRSLGRFAVINGDILKKTQDYGLDAREALDELEGNQTRLFTCTADISPIGLFTVYRLYYLRARKSSGEGGDTEVGGGDDQASALPPILPMYLGDMTCLERRDLLLKLKSRHTKSLPPDFSHMVSADHKELRIALRDSPLFRKDLEDTALKADILEGFCASWRLIL